MQYFRSANAIEEYSQSFWQVRLKFMQSRFTLIFFIIAVLAIALFIVNRYLGHHVRDWYRRYKHAPVLAQADQFFRILRHPVDGFSELRYRRQGTLITAIVLIALLYIVQIGSQQWTGFIFNPSKDRYVDPIITLLIIIVPFISWVVSNYLVSSIFRGEGRFVDVVIGSSYALAPYIIFTIPVAILSNVLTLGESAVYQFLKYGIIGWTLFLFIVCVKEVHNFELGETIRNMVLTVLFALATWLLIVIFFAMNVQLFDFITQIIEELRYRV